MASLTKKEEKEPLDTHNNYIMFESINIGYYFDGGTVGIKCNGKHKGESIRRYGGIITIDRGFFTPEKSRGKWYVGWKDKDGVEITDIAFKHMVIRILKSKIEQDNEHLYGKIIPSLYDNVGAHKTWDDE